MRSNPPTSASVPVTSEQIANIIARCEAANDMPPGAPGESTQEWLERVDVERRNAAWDCVDAIPVLIDEIMRLKEAANAAITTMTDAVTSMTDAVEAFRQAVNAT